MNFSKAEIYVVNNRPREGYGTAFTDSLSDEQDLSNTLALAFDFANKWDFVILKFTDEIGGYWRVLSFDHRSPSGEKTGNHLEEKASAMLQRKEEAKAKRKARKALEDAGTCYRCNGKGYINGYSHVAAGVCFRCKGNGKP